MRLKKWAAVQETEYERTLSLPSSHSHLLPESPAKVTLNFHVLMVCAAVVQLVGYLDSSYHAHESLPCSSLRAMYHAGQVIEAKERELLGLDDPADQNREGTNRAFLWLH